ncbi:MAG TPA: UDP-N-acetylglucosamine 2-epimerase (hydrolyzing) [Spirochaetia bacterium]|nr:UDP-N-acetylglucosamine 2-epimerase (hydrolyzing) [Spirochaetia bacterium]
MTHDICFVTGSRAEYGLLKPLMDLFLADPAYRFSLIVTGSHLSPHHGLTYREIENDGIPVAYKVETQLASDSACGVSKAVALGIMGFAEIFFRKRPDLLIVLGDRTEIFAAVAAAHLAAVPVAHLHGGEVTAGAYDDALRHSITKMSRLHFASTEEYRRRVIQLGEQPESVFAVGALGVDNVLHTSLMEKDTLAQSLRIAFRKNNLLVTYHPVTLQPDASLAHFKNLLAVLAEAAAGEDTLLIFTRPNADAYGAPLNELLDGFLAEHPNRAAAFDSLGRVRYLSLMKYSDAVVGNSSSGIIEAPSMKVPTINIGDRQRGRVRDESVIDCDGSVPALRAALGRALSAEFRDRLSSLRSVYGDGRSAERIKRIIESRLPGLTLMKTFYDCSDMGGPDPKSRDNA